MSLTTARVIPQAILDEIVEELTRIDYGSVEIYIQGKQITQITVRNIKKTNASNGNGAEKKTRTIKPNVFNDQGASNKIRVLTIKK